MCDSQLIKLFLKNFQALLLNYHIFKKIKIVNKINLINILILDKIFIFTRTKKKSSALRPCQIKN